MKKVIPLWLCISLLIGVFGILKTYDFISPDTEYPLFVDIIVMLFFVPSFSIVFSTLLSIFFFIVKSNLAFTTVAIISLITAIVYSFSFFEGIYGILGLFIINFEFLLLAVIHFYISAVSNFYITKKFRNPCI